MVAPGTSMFLIYETHDARDGSLARGEVDIRAVTDIDAHSHE